MKILSLLASCLLFASAAFGQYSYWYTESFNPYYSSYWTVNGTVTQNTTGLADYYSGQAGSLISTWTIPHVAPASAGMYEVETTLNLTNTGGTFVTYLDATTDALSASGSSTGTFYSVELTPTFTGGVCNATINLNKRVSGTLTLVANTTAQCSGSTVVRAVRHFGYISVYVNGIPVLAPYDTSITSGQAGVGVAGAAFPNTMVSVGLGELDVVQPYAVNASTIGTSSFSNRVDIQWYGTTDNSGGSGLAFYQLYRNGSYLGTMNLLQVTSFSDTTVSPGTAYSYTVWAFDYHGNQISTSFGVTTPPSGSVDPRQTGVRPTGAYWGASPEQINLLSGNLNFSLPLLQAKGRSASVGFSLSYNSQNWRQDPGGVWNLGKDVGFGYGWKFLAGAITPFWSDYYTIDHYTFTDSSGAEYRLSVNNGSNVWSSTESIYLQYDANADILHFPDGTFWTFGCTSAGNEQDAGTLYPTVMEDTNGNQILLTYAEGNGTWWANSSARILTIEDVRATAPMGTYYSYAFTYNTDSIPHLTAITNSIGTGETYDLSYSTFSLGDPFIGTSFGTATKLTEVSLPNDSSANYQFTYGGSGDLSQANLLYGGYIRWTYTNFTYTGSRVQHEIAARYLSKDGTSGSEQEYPVSHESDDGAHTIHAQTTINDPGGVGQKYWAFSQSGANLGLATTYKGNDLSAGTTKVENDYTWSQDSAGNNYIGTLVNTLDPGQTYAAAKTTTQTLDTNGNVTALTNYNYGSGYRTYAYSYLNSSGYTSRYIFNRPTSTTVTTNGSTYTTLSTITYDGSSLTGSATPLTWDTSYSGVTARGNPTSVTDVSGITTTTAYDLYGNVATATNGSGVSSSASTSGTTNYAAPDSVTVGSSLTTSMTYASFLGLTSGTGPNGTTVDVGYDSNARPTSSTSPFGATTYTAYTDTGSTPNVCVSTNTRWTQSYMDGLGRAITTYTGSYNTAGPTNCSAGALSVYGQSNTTYGSAGTAPLGLKLTQNVPYSGTTPATVTYTYDGIGRTVSKAVVGPDTAGTTTYSYAGNAVTVTDPAGKVKVFTSDAFGNLVQVVEDPSSLNYPTYYTYDVLNHLTGVSMSRPGFSSAQTRSWSYTGNFLMSATNPENGTISYTYGSNNKVATRTDAKGQATAYTYDSLARLTEVQRYPSGFSGSEDQCQRETYYYDGIEPSPPNGYPVYPSFPANALGRLSGAMYSGGHIYSGSPGCDLTFVEFYTYNVAGAPTGKILQANRLLSGLCCPPDAVTFTAGFSYDNEGRLTGVQYPSEADYWNTYTAPNLSYTYDRRGALETATDNTASQTLVSATSYGPANELLSITGASGGWYGETRTYNSIKQLTSLSSSGVNIAYNYPSSNNNGKIGSQTDFVSGETVTYTYDSLNRLATAQNQTGFSPLWGQSFSYDGFSNLTGTSVTQGSAPTLSATYDVNNHAGGEDANGNPGSIYLPADGSSYAATYDVENRLRSTGSSTIFYSYAPGNRRVWQGIGSWTASFGDCNPTPGSTEEITFWGVNGQKLMNYNLVMGYSGTPSECHFTATAIGTNYYFGNRLIKNAGGYVYPDRLGSIGKFYPYGIERPSATTNGTEKFTGYLRDAESGNDYAINRYMSPGMGRFITPDRTSGKPRDPASWNKYAYTEGDPINFVDPFGRYLEDPTSFLDTAKPQIGLGQCSPDTPEGDCPECDAESCPGDDGGGGGDGGGDDSGDDPGDGSPCWSDPTTGIFTCGTTGTGVGASQDPPPSTDPPAPPPSPPTTNPTPSPAPVPQPPGLPPVQLPSGHVWVPKKPSTPIGRWGFKPFPPVKSPTGSQPCCSWDPRGHWDYDDGTGGPRIHLDPSGNTIAPLVPVGIVGTIIGILESEGWMGIFVLP